MHTHYSIVLAKFWRILLYVTDDAIAKLYEISKIEGNDRNFRHIELSNSVIC